MTDCCIIENNTKDAKLIFGKVSKEYLEVNIETTNASARSNVFMYTDMPLLMALFKDISSNWRGWQGIKKFCSVERDFSIEATHNGISCISLKVSLNSVNNSGVEAETTISMNIECGTLDLIANTVANHLFQNSKGE